MSTPSPDANAPRSSSGWLWASAAVLVGLIVVQIGKLSEAQPGNDRSLALAAAVAGAGGDSGGGVTKVGDFTVMTFNAGNDDALAVMDARVEEMYVYRIRNNAQFEFVVREKLPELFTRAKGGRPQSGK